MRIIKRGNPPDLFELFRCCPACETEFAFTRFEVNLESGTIMCPVCYRPVYVPAEDIDE